MAAMYQAQCQVSEQNTDLTQVSVEGLGGWGFGFQASSSIS